MTRRLTEDRFLDDRVSDGAPIYAYLTTARLEAFVVAHDVDVVFLQLMGSAPNAMPVMVNKMHLVSIAPALPRQADRGHEFDTGVLVDRRKRA